MREFFRRDDRKRLVVPATIVIAVLLALLLAIDLLAPQ